MKYVLTILAILSQICVLAKADVPKMMQIAMIGATGKDMPIIKVFDSTRKDNDQRIVQTSHTHFTDKNILNSLFLLFANERKYDSQIYRDFKFGTFSFYFLFPNEEEIEFVTNRTHSAVILQKIVNMLIIQENKNGELIKTINEDLKRIDLGQINWNPVNKLTWSSYKSMHFGRLEEKSLYSSSIEIDYYFKDTCLYFDIQAIVIPLISPFTDSTNLLLLHEQTSFDINEIFARKIRKLLLENLEQKKDKSFIKNEIKRILTNKSEYQRIYDRRTKFSRKYKAHLKWKKKIEIELLNLNQFTQTYYSNCN